MKGALAFDKTRCWNETDGDEKYECIDIVP